jgi:prophage DNA circulation protein
MSTPIDFAAAAQALAAAVYGASVDPADAIRILSGLSDFTPSDTTGSSAIGAAMATMQRATGDLFRRAAVVALARASSDYQPVSAADAVGVRNTVCDALDREIEIAGDQGEDATFNAMRRLRTAVVRDLTARGAGLPDQARIQSMASVPAPVLAQKIYRDAARGDELVSVSDCVHPAFLPLSLNALSK